MKLKVLPQLPNPQEQLDTYTYVLPQHVVNVESNICTEIELANTLDYSVNRLELLKTVVQKLRLNGVLSLSGIDIVLLSQNAITGQITIDEINNILYNGKQSIDNLQRLLMFVQNLGLEVLDKRISGITYFIKVKRNV